jgi:dienelactone hydrolase
MDVFILRQVTPLPPMQRHLQKSPMRPFICLATALLLAALVATAQASSRQSFIVQTSGARITVDCFAACADASHPAVLILSGSKGFGSPAYDEIGDTFRRAGLNAYLVHFLSPDDLSAIAAAGSSAARVRYYTRRQSQWIAAVSDVVSYFNHRPHATGKAGVLGISLGAEIAAATSANNANIGALVIVDGSFPDGYSQPVHSLPPLLLVWGSADRTFPLPMGLSLQKLARRLGQTPDLEIYKGGAHDFFLNPGTPQARAAHWSAANFLVSQLSVNAP